MGNCQAIDNASLVIQHPSGRVDKMYSPIAANQIMKMNPGHYVALLLTTTLYSTAAIAGAGTTTSGGGKTIAGVGKTIAGGGATDKNNKTNSTAPLRITRIKLLRPTDTLVLGHAYRLVTSQDVMKGVFAKKQGKLKQQQPAGCGKTSSESAEQVMRKTHEVEKIKQAKHERNRSRNNTSAVNSLVSKSRPWQPALTSISEANGS